MGTTDTPFHPEQYPGAINSFGFYKIQRNSKTILINILKNFFSEKSQLYKVTMPEIIEKLVDTTIPKLFVERNFPFMERKLPLIATAIKQAKEKKAYIGADNLLYPEVVRSSTGDYLTGYNVYAGMSDLDVTFIIAALSPEERMQLVEMLNMCFTHYYRWQYFYYDEENNMFNIVPNTVELTFGGESEVKDQSNLSWIYVTTVDMKCRIEYTFKDFAFRFDEIKHYEIDPDSGVIEY
jgi:hypothetical protein